MKRHLIWMVAITLSIVVGCAKEADEVLLRQEGKNPDGTPQKVRHRLAITDGRGVSRDANCVQEAGAAAIQANTSIAATELASIIESKCEPLEGRSIAGDGDRMTVNQDNYSTPYYYGYGYSYGGYWRPYIPYYYPRSYYDRPWYNGYNLGCSNTFGNWGNYLRYNCYSDVLYWGAAYAGAYYNAYCSNYCTWWQAALGNCTRCGQ